jgi:hypothetical protein
MITIILEADTFLNTFIIIYWATRRVGWAGHVVHMGRRGMRIKFWWESQKGRDHYEVLDVGGRIILKCILERWDEVVWTGFMKVRVRTSGGLVNTVMKLWVPKNGKFLNC